jgi:serine phosphatase RsbU (regulator of sigma subunit)
MSVMGQPRLSVTAPAGRPKDPRGADAAADERTQAQRVRISSGRLRVLLVEDDEADAFLVGELLTEVRAPVDLTVVKTLAEARGQLADVDCVLLDLGLPDAQGLDTLRELLRQDDVAVCVLTGMEDEHLGAAAVAEGAEDYLIKGKVDGAVLARALRYAVERQRADQNALRLREVELREAESARLERGLLPQPLITTTAVHLNLFYLPGRASNRAVLGGDFYDAVQTSDDQLELLVGDVAGHDIDEAALGAELRVAWRALVLGGVAAGAVLPALEKVLMSERPAPEIFATVATVTVDLAADRIGVRLAGHPPPILITDEGCQPIPVPFGAVLGVFPPSEREAHHLDLGSSRWSLLMYTDGLIEGRTGPGAERLGLDGLCAMLSAPEARGMPPADLPAWLVGRAEEANGGPLSDDVAMLLLTRDGG